MNNFAFDPVVVTGEPHVDQFASYVRKVLDGAREERRQKDFHGKSYGNYGIWQLEKIQNFEDMPKDRYARFNQFLEETAPEVESGLYHLHLFYDRKRGEAYWKLIKIERRTRICGTGRCKQVYLEQGNGRHSRH